MPSMWNIPIPAFVQSMCDVAIPATAKREIKMRGVNQLLLEPVLVHCSLYVLQHETPT